MTSDVSTEEGREVPFPASTPVSLVVGCLGAESRHWVPVLPPSPRGSGSPDPRVQSKSQVGSPTMILSHLSWDALPTPRDDDRRGDDGVSIPRYSVSPCLAVLCGDRFDPYLDSFGSLNLLTLKISDPCFVPKHCYTSREVDLLCKEYTDCGRGRVNPGPGKSFPRTTVWGTVPRWSTFLLTYKGISRKFGLYV